MVAAKALLLCTVISAVWAKAPAAVQAESGWQEKVNEEGRKVQQLQISAPSMTEEDQYGYVMPDRYRCDSCRAVIYHLNEALTKRQLKNRQLRESELEEIFEETCKTGFKGYGITLVDGENALSGPALQRADGIQPGSGSIQMGGETWEKRLGELCRKFVYDKVGDEELYQHFYAGGKISEDLCVSHSRDCQASVGEASGKKTKKTKAERKEKAAPAPAVNKKPEAQARMPSKEMIEKIRRKKEEQVKNGDMSAKEAGLASDDEVRESEASAVQKQSQKELSRQAREQKLKKDVETARQTRTNAPSVTDDDQLDAETFFKQLTVEYNLPVDDYAKKHTAREWEQLLIRAAGKIYERRAMETTVQV